MTFALIAADIAVNSLLMLLVQDLKQTAKTAETLASSRLRRAEYPSAAKAYVTWDKDFAKLILISAMRVKNLKPCALSCVVFAFSQQPQHPQHRKCQSAVKV